MTTQYLHDLKFLPFKHITHLFFSLLLAFARTRMLPLETYENEKLKTAVDGITDTKPRAEDI